MEETIKSIRIRIDSLAGLAKDNLHYSRQVELCIDELFLAKAWLGKALGEIGTPSPYPKDGSRKGVQDIERTAEQANALVMNDLYITEAGFEGKNAVERVDWLRQAIGDTIKTMAGLSSSSMVKEISMLVHNNIVTHLSEARFWLGFELERQREEAHETHQG